MGDEFDYKLQLLVVGDSEVGKTSLCQRFCEDSFPEHYSETVGVDFTFQVIELGKKKVKLQIFSASGSERFRSVSNAYYKGSDGVIIVYDITNQESFDHLRNYVLDVGSYSSNTVKKMVIGNKSDLISDRVISYKTAQEYADQIQSSLFETSAKDSTNVEEAFSTLALEIIQDRESNMILRNTDLQIVKSSEKQTPAKTQSISNKHVGQSQPISNEHVNQSQPISNEHVNQSQSISNEHANQSCSCSLL